MGSLFICGAKITQTCMLTLTAPMTAKLWEPYLDNLYSYGCYTDLGIGHGPFLLPKNIVIKAQALVNVS